MSENQKLDRRNTYTPEDYPQIPISVDPSLNRVETLRVHGLKTHSNNPDVSLQSGMTECDLGNSSINIYNMENI